MASSLGDCMRCITRHPATSVQRLSYGESAYELRLCESQADKFLRDLIGWSRVGTLVEEADKATFKPKAVPRRERGGRVVASRLHVPSAVVEEPEPLPTQRSPRFDTSLPINHDRWTWTDHATQRAQLRQVSTEAVLWCAEHPDTVRPGKDGTLFHYRGSIKVAIDPVTYTIITVADRRYADDDERDLQDAC